MNRILDHLAPDLMAKTPDEGARIQVDVRQRSFYMASISELSVVIPGFS
jgi:hypothetical protein